MARPSGTNGQKLATEASFPVSISGTAGCGKTKTKMESPKKLELQGTGLKN
jgi:hypothetical protein